MHQSLMPVLRRTLLLALLLLLVGGYATSGRLSEYEQARVAGHTYVITGASSGLGRGVALRLAGLHANVVLAARRTAELDKVAAEAVEAGGQALVVTTDVADAAQMERLAAAALARLGRIDGGVRQRMEREDAARKGQQGQQGQQ
jgi:hypothetical protein